MIGNSLNKIRFVLHAVLHDKETLALKLGLKIYKCGEISARAATGPLTFNESAVVTLDFGVVKANSVFVVCSHPMYAEDLILLGSSALKSLGIVADFENDMIYIKNMFPVKLFDDKQTAEQHILQMKREFVSLSAIKVKPNQNILIPAQSETFVDIQMSKFESAQLNGTYTFFTSDNCQLDGVTSPDMVIDNSLRTG